MRFSLRRLMLIVAGLAFLFAVATRIEPSEQRIHSMGETIIVGLERWRADHGRYPSTLAEAGLESPTRHFGGFRYQTDDDGISFVLSIGHADGVEVCHDYESKCKQWDCHD